MDEREALHKHGAVYFGAAAQYGITRAWEAAQLVVLECTIPGKTDLYSMRDLALERLGLTQASSEPSVQLVFGHALNTGNIHAWEGLFLGAVGATMRLDDNIPLAGESDTEGFDLEAGIDIAVERIEKLEHDKMLLTYLLPEYYVAAPTVFMDFTDNPLGFVVFAAGDNDDRISCLIYPEEYATRWIEEIGSPLVSGILPGATSCPFGSVKDQLIHDARRRNKMLFT